MNSTQASSLFIGACKNGEVGLSRHLIHELPSNHDWNQTFDITCIAGELEMAQWLLQMKPDDIVISTKIYRDVCLMGQWQVAKWLRSLNPEADRQMVQELLPTLTADEIQQSITRLRNAPSDYDTLPLLNAFLEGTFLLVC